MSPPVASRARLQSIMPAWVRSRSSLTICGVICAISVCSSSGSDLDEFGGFILRLRRGFGFLAALLALEHRVRHLAGQKPHGPDRVVVAGDDVVDVVGVAVGVHDRDDGNAQLL